jgi:hypothetical protein
MTTFQTNRNAVLNALNECGVGENLGERLNETNDQLADFCANLQKNVIRQAIYNELTNKPCGIEHRNALRMGIVSAIGNLIKWDVIDALELAADIAEDVNAHSEAAAIREMAERANSKPPKIILEGKPGFIATLGFPDEGSREANAAYIVKACNAYPHAERLAEAAQNNVDVIRELLDAAGDILESVTWNRASNAICKSSDALAAWKEAQQ